MTSSRWVGEDPPSAAANVGDAVEERLPAEPLDGPVGVEARSVVVRGQITTFGVSNHDSP